MVRCSQAIDGGLDMAVAAFTGGQLEWVSEIDPAACRILQAHHPGVPNLGDVTKVDWATVPPVDVLTGGYPCQPFSHAGHRKGQDDERHLWPHVRDALAALRPMVAVFENVDGHRSLGLGDVIGDIADLGLSARWGVVRASDAGAPHQRARVFIVANPGGRSFARTGAARVGLSEPAERGTEPAADADSAGSEARVNSRRHGAWLRDESVGLANITRDAEVADGINDGETAGETQNGHRAIDWGQYEPAIRRWERVLNRPAPSPTIPGSNGRPRLSPAFVEWMMGLPEGHVTGHGLSNAQALKMLGNGVVPQQALLALTLLMDRPPLTNRGGPI